MENDDMHFRMCELNKYYKILLSKDPSYTPSKALDVVYGIFFDDEEEEDRELMELVRNPPQSSSEVSKRQERQNFIDSDPPVYASSYLVDEDQVMFDIDQEEENDEIDLNVCSDDDKN